MLNVDLLTLSFCSFSEIIKPFLGRIVTVEIDGYEITGRLVHYRLNGERKLRPHKPAVLVLVSGKQFLLVRGSWTVIKLLEPRT